MTIIQEFTEHIKLYHSLGWPVMPVRGKVAYIKSFPEVESFDLSTAGKGENIGILTGERSGLVVLDIDPKNGGSESLAELEAEHGTIETLQVLTGGGGIHFYFAYPEGKEIGNKANLLPGVDIRGIGGYVVAPPSIHPDTGKAYEWEASYHPEETQAAPMPEWLIELIEKPKGSSSPAAAIPEAIEEGGRNDTLFRMASGLRDKGYSLLAIKAALSEENKARCNPPLPDIEVEKIVESVMKYVPKHPIIINDGGIHFRRTDSGNAELLAHHMGNKIRYCFEYKKWLIYDGKRWRVDNQEHIFKLAKKVIRQEHKRYEGDEEAQKYYRGCESKSKLQNMIFLAQSELPIAQGELDADKHLINCRNGVLDLEKSILLPHNPKYFMTKMCNASYDPNNQSTLWQDTLDQILPDKSVQGFVQRFCGYTLTGSTEEEKFIVAVGSGGNGKGVLIETIGAALGDYATTVSVDILLASQKYTSGNEPTPELAKMAGARMVLASETGKGRNLDEAKVKAITGGDQITARKLHCEPFSYIPDFKLWLSTNFPPRVRGDDEGIWRRLRIVTFDQSFNGSKRNPKLKTALRKPQILSSVLNWAVEGLIAWRMLGLAEPEKVIQATDKFRRECDVIEQFLEERCERGDNFKVKTSELYQAYKNWSIENGYIPNSKISFKRLFEDKGFYSYKTDGFYHWMNIKCVPQNFF